MVLAPKPKELGLQRHLAPTRALFQGWKFGGSRISSRTPTPPGTQLSTKAAFQNWNSGADVSGVQFWNQCGISFKQVRDHLELIFGLVWDQFGIILESFWDHAWIIL